MLKISRHNWLCSADWHQGHCWGEIERRQDDLQLLQHGVTCCHSVSTHINIHVQTTILLLLHPFNGLFSRTTWVSRYQKGKTSLDLNEARNGEVLGCSGISWTYANNLHLAPDRQPYQHPIAQFLQAGCCSWRPSNSVKALKAYSHADHRYRYAGTQKGQMYDENNSLSWTRNSHIGVASRETWECKTHTHTPI